MRHERFPAKARKAACHAQPCIAVYYYPQEIYWCVERYFGTRKDGSKFLTAGREVARVSSWLVAVNVAQHYARRHGVPLVIDGGRT